MTDPIYQLLNFETLKANCNNKQTKNIRGIFKKEKNRCMTELL